MYRAGSQPAKPPPPQRPLSLGRAVLLLRGAGVPHPEGWGTDDGSGVLIKRTEFNFNLSARLTLVLDLDFDVAEIFMWSGRETLLAATVWPVTTWTEELRKSVLEKFKVDWSVGFAETEVEIFATNPPTLDDLLLTSFDEVRFNEDAERFRKEQHVVGPMFRALGEQNWRHLPLLRPFVLFRTAFAAMTITMEEPWWDEEEDEDIAVCHPKLTAEAEFKARNGETYRLHMSYEFQISENLTMKWKHRDSIITVQ